MNLSSLLSAYSEDQLRAALRKNQVRSSDRDLQSGPYGLSSHVIDAFTEFYGDPAKGLRKLHSLVAKLGDDRYAIRIENAPYHIPSLPLNLALRLKPNPSSDLLSIAELLRRCHHQHSFRKYHPDDQGKDNYDQDQGLLIIRPDGKLQDLLNARGESFGLTWFPWNPQGDLFIVEDWIQKMELTVGQYLLTWAQCPSYKQIPILEDLIEDAGLVSTPDLVNALEQAFHENVLLITGEAGTGKSTVIELITQIADQNNLEYRICAYTGKAVDRLQQRNTIQPECLSTIHSLVYQMQKMKVKFRLLIIDETSMAPTWLIHRLFKVLMKENLRVQVILVGDVNQLPPIGWGRFFHTLIDIQLFPIATLTQNFRTEKSLIIRNALLFRQEESTGELQWDSETFSQLTSREEFWKLFRDPDTSSVVICPWNKVVRRLNNEIQTFLYPTGGLEYEYYKEKIRWQMGDRVIFTRNSRINSVFNGTSGRVSTYGTMIIQDPKRYHPQMFYYLGSNGQIHKCEISKMVRSVVVQTLIIRTSHHRLEIPIIYRPKGEGDDEEQSQLENLGITIQDLQLSYCLTTHKAQGSEWDHVLLYLEGITASYIGGGKANVYTALTRAKQHLYYYGSIETLRMVRRIGLSTTHDYLSRPDLWLPECQPFEESS